MDMNNFENYLKRVHASQYRGTDDDMPDSFDNWVTDLDIDTVIKMAQEWGDSYKQS